MSPWVTHRQALLFTFFCRKWCRVVTQVTLHGKQICPQITAMSRLRMWAHTSSPGSCQFCLEKRLPEKRNPISASVPGIRDQRPGARNQRLGTKDRGAETREQGPWCDGTVAGERGIGRVRRQGAHCKDACFRGSVRRSQRSRLS